MKQHTQGRSHEQEYLDLGPGHYTEKEYLHCLHQLGRIGKYLGNHHAALQILRKMAPPACSLLDVGCGGGQFALTCARLFPSMQICGIDLSPAAIAYAARQKEKTSLCNAHYRVQTSTSCFAEEKSVDAVTSALVCHHMKEKEIVSFIQQACRVARKKVILVDLHRHILAQLLFAIVAPLFFRNKLILHDGLVSIRRSFVKADWKRYLSQAGVDETKYRISWSFPFRWVVVIEVASHA